MPLSVERSQPEQSPRVLLFPELNVGNAKQFGLRLVLGALVVAAGAGLRPSTSRAADGEVYQGPGQATAADIKPCGPETLARTLCYDSGFDDPSLQKIYLATPAQGGDGNQSLNFALQCDIASKLSPAEPDKCFNPEGIETMPATKANVDQPQFANVFANTQQPAAEPTPVPSPEPVAQPAEVDPFSLPTGVVFQEPFAPGKRWLGNVDSCIRDAQHYNPTTYKCISSKTVFSPSDPIVITFRREGILSTEAKQGPGDRIMTRTIRVNSTGREQFRYSTGPEITRFSSGDVFYAPATGVFPTGVYEFSSNVNNGPDQFVYRIQFK